MDEIEVSEYLDNLAEELRADLPQEGEYTIATYRAEMEKRGLKLTVDCAHNQLDGFVSEGKWTVRDGHATNGRPSKIYKPIL